MAKWLSKIKPRTRIIALVGGLIAVAVITSVTYLLNDSNIFASSPTGNAKFQVLVSNIDTKFLSDHPDVRIRAEYKLSDNNVKIAWQSNADPSMPNQTNSEQSLRITIPPPGSVGVDWNNVVSLRIYAYYAYYDASGRINTNVQEVSKSNLEGYFAGAVGPLVSLSFSSKPSDSGSSAGSGAGGSGSSAGSGTGGTVTEQKCIESAGSPATHFIATKQSNGTWTGGGWTLIITGDSVNNESLKVVDMSKCTAGGSGSSAGSGTGGTVTQNTVKVNLYATIDGKKTPVVNGSVFYRYNKIGTGWTNMPETRTTETQNYAYIAISVQADAVKNSKYYVVGSKSFVGGRTVYTEQKEIAVPTTAGASIDLSFENRITTAADANDTSGSYTAIGNPGGGTGLSAPTQAGKPFLPSGNCSVDTSVWIPSYAAGDKHFTPAGNANVVLTFTYPTSEWNKVGTTAVGMLQPEVAYAKTGSEVCGSGSMDGYIGALDGKSIIVCYKESDTNAVYWLTNVADKAVKTGTFQGNEDEIDGTVSTPYGQLKVFGRTKDLLWLENAVSKTTTGIGTGAVPSGSGVGADAGTGSAGAGTGTSGGSGGSGGTGVPQISVGAPYNTGVVKPVFGNSKIEYNSKVKSINGRSKDLSINTPDNGSTLSIKDISCEGVVKVSVNGPQGFFNTQYWAPISTTTDMKKLPTVVDNGANVPPIIDTGDGNIRVLHQLNSIGKVYLAEGVSYCPKGYAIFVAGNKNTWFGWQCADVDDINNPTVLSNYTTGTNKPFQSEADYGLPKLSPGELPSVLGNDGKSSSGNVEDRIKMCLRDVISLTPGNMSLIEAMLMTLLTDMSTKDEGDLMNLVSNGALIYLASRTGTSITKISEKIPCLLGSSTTVAPGMGSMYMPIDQMAIAATQAMRLGYSNSP